MARIDVKTAQEVAELRCSAARFKLWIEDANVNAIRPAIRGDYGGPGEVLLLTPEESSRQATINSEAQKA